MLLPLPTRALAAIVPDDFATVQGAIDSGAEEVLVRPGIYAETPRIDHPMVLRALLPDGSMDLPRIDGVILDSDWQMSAHSADVWVANFHIAGHVRNVFHTDLYSGPLSLVFDGCIIDSAITDAGQTTGGQLEWRITGCTIGAGVHLTWPQEISLIGNSIHGPVVAWSSSYSLWAHGNTVDGSGSLGMSLTSGEHLSVVGNVVHGFDTGIEMSASNGVTARDNQVEDCSGTALFIASGWDNATVEKNTIRRCGAGINASRQDALSADSNLVEDVVGTAILLSSGDQITARDNAIRRCGYGIHTVGLGFATITNNLVEQCGTGLFVERADGTSVLDNRVRTCEYGILVISGYIPSAVGRNSVEDCRLDGIVIHSDYYGTAHDNRVSGCFQGIVAGNIALRDNRVERCVGVGIATEGEGTTCLRDTVIDCGGGFYLTQDDVTITRALVLSCRGVGILSRASRLTVDSCVVGRNGSDGVFVASEVFFELRNNTSYLNGGSGFAITDQYRSEGVVTRNLAYRNGELGLKGFNESTILGSCNDWFGNELGSSRDASTSGDLSVDPLFCNLSQDDVHLRNDSPLSSADSCGLIGAKNVDCDAITPVLVSAFTATFASGGARIEWHVEALEEAGLSLERGMTVDGPWSVVQEGLRPVGFLLDQAVSQGESYWYRLMGGSGEQRRMLGNAIELGASPTSLGLSLSCASPISSATRVHFTVGRSSHVVLDVLDVQGRLVSQLVNGEVTQGAHVAEWRALDTAPGVYLLCLRSDDRVIVRKVGVVR